jgi:hypothetical protein
LGYNALGGGGIGSLLGGGDGGVGGLLGNSEDGISDVTGWKDIPTMQGTF